MKAARILIVEDEGLVAQDIRHRLVRMGYPEPSIANTGETAVKQAIALQPDLILIDIVLANGYLDGIDAAKRIRKFLDVPIVYITASSDSQTLTRAKLTEPNAYILKPFQTRELQIVIELILYKHQVEKELMEKARLVSAELRNMQEGVIAFDSKGQISFMNLSAEKLTGWLESDAIGKPLGDVLSMKNLPDMESFELDNHLSEKIPIESVPSHGLLLSKNGLSTEVFTFTKSVPKNKEVDVDRILVIRDYIKK
ncbi:response regulator [Leptospira sp. WS58.C1]|uniref:response regulator n=1 Tax=Leptospira TaxID=171 RepID=UPI0002BFA576|nr:MULTISPECIES: response regulator [unclassified Leptospira]EMK01951.1 response regulator receiver domain protein [Leptospira sp. B5-022]MCR1795165.1 response regulator [Leptospira sp. id769339]